MNVIGVVVPSRGRPQNVERLLRAPRPNLPLSETDSVEWVVTTDADDPRAGEYDAHTRWHPRCLVMPGRPRGDLGSSFRDNVNRGAKACERFSTIIVMGDDMLPRASGWATKLARAAGPWGMAYPDDMHQGEAKPTMIALGGKLYRALGFALPEAMEHLFTDDYWLALGRGLEAIAYVPEVQIEHLHPDAGKAEPDESYDRTYRQRQWDLDGSRWRVYRATQLALDVARVGRARQAALARETSHE